MTDDDTLMDEDMEEFLSANAKTNPAPAVETSEPSEADEAAESPKAAKKAKRAERFGRKVESESATEDPGLWEQRLKILWDDYLIRSGRPADRKTRFYKCLDPRCGLISEALTTEERAQLPETHPERVVRCPNVGTDKHERAGISLMEFVD